MVTLLWKSRTKFWNELTVPVPWFKSSKKTSPYTPISVSWYTVSDLIATVLSAVLFFNSSAVLSLLPNITFENVVLITIFWMCWFVLTGSYNTFLYHRSRLKELTDTFLQVLSGCLILWLILVIEISSFNAYVYFSAFIYLLALQFLFTVSGRLLLLFKIHIDLLQGKYCFNSIFIGSSVQALQSYKQTRNNFGRLGYNVVGYINPDSTTKDNLLNHLPLLGSLNDLDNVIQTKNVTQVIIGLDRSQQATIDQVINKLGELDVIVKLIPNSLDIVAGSVKTRQIFGDAFVQINTHILPTWQENIKRLMDIILSLVSLIILMPLLIFIAIKTKFSSPGTILYSQLRIGKKGRPFTIYKFRSMHENAEQNGPMLSSDDDSRITPWGKFMRKWRLDELPQLFNILKGDMSLVGPRPERKFYIDQIAEKTPYYRYLLKTKPGLTSWGMVQFGYASSLEEMIERMRYDLIYIENASILLDLKIMLYTLKTIVLGKGK